MPARTPRPTKAQAANDAAVWRNRIVGEGEEAPDQLLANPANWRIHPKNQQDALAGVLSQVGWVQRVIVNRRTQHIVDGHMRVALAISANAPTVPVVYVDLTDEEEALILATIDPISAMAATDADKLRELMELVSTDEPAIGAMLAALGESSGVIEALDEPAAHSEVFTENWMVLIELSDEQEQFNALQTLSEMGFKCRAPTS